MQVVGSADSLELTMSSGEWPKPSGKLFLCDNGPEPVYARPLAGAEGERDVHGKSGTVEPDPLESLLCASGDGDRRAFARVYEITAPRLFPIALRLLRRRDEAEDVLQEAYVLIWRKAAQYHPDRGRPLPWMATIVRNRAIDRLRAQARQPRGSAQWDEVAEGLADPMATAATAHAPESIAIRSCLEGLQENQRKAILLAYYYGLTHEELSARLDAPLGTVKSWVRRGLLQLKDCLEA